MNVAMIGTGYVGLESLVNENVRRNRLSFTTDHRVAVEGAHVVFIAVGTPTRRGDGHADLTFVYDAAREIAANLRGYTVVVNKSTVPVGTARAVKRIIRDNNPEADFDVASNPEFLREGSALGDFMRPDRVVIGVESARAEELLRELYRPLYLIETPMVITGLETAGANVKEVAKAMGLDKRIVPALLEGGAKIRATDPQGVREARKLLKDVEFVDDPYDAAKGADALIVLTEWNEYRALDTGRLKELMRGSVFIDLRVIYDPARLREQGFTYIGVGVV